jgi:hypothetical protein
VPENLYTFLCVYGKYVFSEQQRTFRCTLVGRVLSVRKPEAADIVSRVPKSSPPDTTVLFFKYSNTSLRLILHNDLFSFIKNS